jgi:hypothetical protein
MKWSWSVALLCALPVHGEIHVLDIEPEVQRHSQLCWAAVSVMATRAFPASATYRPATQEEIVIYEEAGVNTLAIGGAAEPQTVTKARTDCGVNYAKCNEPQQPWLLGLASNKINKLAPGLKRMLTPEHFRVDFAVRKTPIIIRWFYVVSGDSETESADPNYRFGMHALIVTGYDDVTQDLRVWDPWPEHNQVTPSGHVRHKWISMKRYVHPVNDNGKRVVAKHGGDEFAIRLGTQPSAPGGYPALIQVPPEPPANAPVPVHIANRPPTLQQAIDGAMGDLVVRAENGSVLRGPFEAGRPFPIVALSSAEIDQQRARLEGLFRPESTAMVVPVMQGGRLVESFLLLREGAGWVEGGYSNNEIARLLVNIRRERASPQRAEAGFYLVSIPEEGSFFAAHGFKDQANLISLDDGARGDFVPAKRALTDILGQIDRRKTGTEHVVRPQ